MRLKQSTIDRLKKDYGNWVLVTGATSGIGEEIALRLGEAGFNMVITGRREHLLTRMSTRLFEAYGVEVIPLAGDLSQQQDVETLMRDTAHLSIGIAILNAGFGTSGHFIEAEIEQELNMMDLNCRALLQLTHHFARQMASQPGRGAIVLMSSMVAFQGVPHAAHYAASKAYVQTLGEAIALELKPKGVDVLCAAPGPVASGFADRAGMRMNMTLKPAQVAVPIIRAIGRRNNLLPGLLTRFLVYNLRMTPRWGKIRIMGKVMAGFTNVE